MLTGCCRCRLAHALRSHHRRSELEPIGGAREASLAHMLWRSVYGVSGKCGLFLTGQKNDKTACK